MSTSSDAIALSITGCAPSIASPIFDEQSASSTRTHFAAIGFVDDFAHARGQFRREFDARPSVPRRRRPPCSVRANPAGQACLKMRLQLACVAIGIDIEGMGVKAWDIGP